MNQYVHKFFFYDLTHKQQWLKQNHPSPHPNQIITNNQKLSKSRQNSIDKCIVRKSFIHMKMLPSVVNDGKIKVDCPF